MSLVLSALTTDHASGRLFWYVGVPSLGSDPKKLDTKLLGCNLLRGGFLGFGFGEGAAGFADEHGEIVVIVDIGNEEIIFRTVVGRRHLNGT